MPNNNNKVFELTRRQKQVLYAIYKSLEESGFPPTLADLRNELNVSSNQAVLDFLKILEDKGFIEKEEGAARGIKILKKGFEALEVKPLILYGGTSSAGSYMQVFEDVQWKTYGDVDATTDLLIKVNGDSMIGAGIEDGDIVIIRKAREFKSGDIVLARNNDESTIKRFIHDKGRVFLKPENSKYKNIPIYPETRIIGKVVGIVGKYFKK